MKKSKKIVKAKGKPKYQLGNDQPYNSIQGKGASANTVDSVSSAIPVWGQVFGATRGLSKSIKGDETSTSRNAIANVFSPSSGVTSAIDEGASTGDVAITALNPIGGGKLAADRAKKRKDIFVAQQQANLARNLGQGESALPTFKFGGDIDSSLKTVKGGHLQRISKDAVQVKANQPTQTDSVELPHAFVDHDEVIDRENRVFSDKHKTPEGKTIAKEAKKLEKMKSTNPKHTAANAHVEGKLDRLFDYQQSLNRQQYADGGELPDGEATQQYMAEGGKIHIKPQNRGKFTAYKERTGKTTEEALHSSDAHASKMANFAKNAKKWHHADGGTLEQKPTVLSSRKPYSVTHSKSMNQPTTGTKSVPKRGLTGGGDYGDLVPNLNFTQEQIAASRRSNPNIPTQTQVSDYNFNSTVKSPINNVQQPYYQPAKTSFNWGKVGSAVSTFGPDLVNAGLASQMPKVPGAITESNVNLQRFRPGAQLAENARQARNASQQVRATSSQAGNTASNIGAILAKRLYADNQTNDNINGLNADINNQESAMNLGVGARNTDRRNTNNLFRVEQKNRQLSAYSQIAANVGQKAGQIRRENNLKDLSMTELDVLKKQYEDSGVYDRNLQKLIDDYKKRQGLKQKNKFGGWLK